MLSENLFRKLGIRAGDTILLIDSPLGVVKLLEQIAPPGVLFSQNLDDQPFDQILFWPHQLGALKHRMVQLANIIDPAGAIWLIIPKKKDAPARGISFAWEDMQLEALQTDLVDNKIASFSETDYATRSFGRSFGTSTCKDV